MILPDEAATGRLGEQLAGLLARGDVITLSGPLSAGKTTLVRGLLAGLGHRGEVPSPSFSIVQPYDELSLPVWHVDLYRVEARSELEELGLDEAAGEGVTIVEWPQHAGSNAWPDALALSLDFAEGGARSLTAIVPAAWEGRWPPQ